MVFFLYLFPFLVFLLGKINKWRLNFNPFSFFLSFFFKFCSVKFLAIASCHAASQHLKSTCILQWWLRMTCHTGRWWQSHTPPRPVLSPLALPRVLQRALYSMEGRPFFSWLLVSKKQTSGKCDESFLPNILTWHLHAVLRDLGRSVSIQLPAICSYSILRWLLESTGGELVSPTWRSSVSWP